MMDQSQLLALYLERILRSEAGTLGSGETLSQLYIMLVGLSVVGRDEHVRPEFEREKREGHARHGCEDEGGEKERRVACARRSASSVLLPQSVGLAFLRPQSAAKPHM
jgi:hypothetical protein